MHHHIPVDLLLCEQMRYTVPRVCCCVDASLSSSRDGVVTACGGVDWKFLRRLSIRDMCYPHNFSIIYNGVSV